MRVRIVDYDPEWPRRFEREAARIRAAVREGALRIEHVGSTSVPGLAAKPIVDIVLVVADSADERVYADRLESAGYRLRIREPEWFEHRMFQTAAGDVNLHLFSEGCAEIERLTAFRDWLRGNAGDRELYARAKRELAEREWGETQDYANAKDGVVAEITARCESAQVQDRRVAGGQNGVESHDGRA